VQRCGDGRTRFFVARTGVNTGSRPAQESARPNARKYALYVSLATLCRSSRRVSRPVRRFESSIGRLSGRSSVIRGASYRREIKADLSNYSVASISRHVICVYFQEISGASLARHLALPAGKLQRIIELTISNKPSRINESRYNYNYYYRPAREARSLLGLT